MEQKNYSHRQQIPEKLIDPAIARDTEITWTNLIGKPTFFAPSSHNHLEQNDDGVEVWLADYVSNRIAGLINSSHAHTGAAFFSRSGALTANTWVTICTANVLKKYKFYALKILIESVSLSPYSGAAATHFATTNCNGAALIWNVPILWHNGAGGTINLRASGGAQTSPAIDIQIPVALPSGSLISAELLELF